MKDVATVVGAIIMVIAIVVITGLLLSLPVMWLWNGCLIPATTGLHTITWTQAWGIMVLFGFLFKSSSTNSKSE